MPINTKDNTIVGVWSNIYSTNKLPEDLYQKTGKHLTKGVEEGYALSVKWKAKDDLMLKSLKNNVWRFSAAKTYQNIRGLEAAKNALKRTSAALVDEHGDKITPYKAFRDGYYNKDGKFIEGASQIYDTFNETWLKTEYDTALGMAQMASRWQRIQENADTLPYLQFNAVNDGVICEICAELDGMTLPVNDPNWDEYYPLIHWLCRCTVEQLDDVEGKENEWTQDEAKEAIAAANEKAGNTELFKFNPGKDKIVFQTDGEGKHPYFDVAKGDRTLLKNNFDLPIPHEDNLNMPIYTLQEAQEQMAKYNISHEENIAIEKYTAGEYNPINGYLRGVRKELPEESKETMNNLDSFIKNAPKVDVTSYRGYTVDADEFKRLKALKKGELYRDKGFMSTSYDKAIPDNFLGSEPWQVVLSVKSEKGVLIEDWAHFSKEKEVLFGKDSQFIVESVKTTGKPGMYGKIYINLKDTKTEIPKVIEKQLQALPQKTTIKLATEQSTYSSLKIGKLNGTEDLTGDKIRSMLRASGVPDDMDGNVHFEKLEHKAGTRKSYSDGAIKMTLWGDNNKVYMCRIFKGTEIHNDYFRIENDSKYKGHGAEIFKSQVEQARKEGYSNITTNAAKSTSKNLNGYYTWLRLGYKEDISQSWHYNTTNEQKKKIEQFLFKYNMAAYKANPKGFKHVNDLFSLFNTQQGRDYWKEKGFTVDLKFNLKEESTNSKRLDEYIKEKKEVHSQHETN